MLIQNYILCTAVIKSKNLIIFSVFPKFQLCFIVVFTEILFRAFKFNWQYEFQNMITKLCKSFEIVT